MLYIIEHLEDEMYNWCVMEYKHMSEIVGRENLVFTNVKKGGEKLKNLGRVEEKSISELNMDGCCVLDPMANKELNPSDKENFKCLVFGGILGDYPMKKRTKKLLSSKFNAPTRDLGKQQMSTDTAVLVAKKVMEGIEIIDIDFADGIELDIDDGESVQLPFRYVLENGKPVLPKGLIKHLRESPCF